MSLTGSFLFLILSLGSLTFATEGKKDFCSAQLVFDFEDTEKLEIQRNRFKDKSLIPMRTRQLINESRNLGFVSFTGIQTLKQIALARPDVIFRFVLREGSELVLFEGHVANMSFDPEGRFMVELTRGKTRAQIAHNPSEVFMVFHPEGPISQLFSPL